MEDNRKRRLKPQEGNKLPILPYIPKEEGNNVDDDDRVKGNSASEQEEQDMQDKVKSKSKELDKEAEETAEWIDKALGDSKYRLSKEQILERRKGINKIFTKISLEEEREQAKKGTGPAK